MYIFNDRKFAKNDKEMVDSLFSSSGTCHGFYKVTKNGIKLYKIDRTPEAFIVLNQSRRYVVSMGKLANGKEFYMQSMCSSTEKWLDVENISMTREQELIDISMQG